MNLDDINIVRIEFSPTDHICDDNGQLWSDGIPRVEEPTRRRASARH